MKRKILSTMFALFLFFTAGTMTAIFYMSGNISELKRLIQLHEVEQLRRSLIIKLQNVQRDLYAMGTPLAREIDFIVKEVNVLEKTSLSCLGCHHAPHLETRIKNMQNLVHQYEANLSAYITASANVNRITRMKQNAADTGDRLLKVTEEMSHSASKNIAFKTALSMQRLGHVKTIMFITHDLDEALRLGDRLVVLMDGRVRQEGTPQQIFAAPADEEVAAFVGIETIAPGWVQDVADGLATIAVGDRVVEAGGDVAAGDGVLVCLRPEDVTPGPPSDAPTSARNHLPATVTRVIPAGPWVRVELDAGFPLVSLITKQSLEALSLAPGSEAVATFKATAVHLIRRQGAGDR